MRVGDMALDAGHRDPDIDRTPAPDLHHIAQPMFRRRLADQTEVRYMAVRFHPFQKLHRAEGGRALLVSGDDEAERAVMVADPPGGGAKGGDRALHVRATAMENAARDLPGHRLLRTAMADRHDASMAQMGKAA